jgi:NADH-ubiquinone oxidoreductase chain 6
MNNFLLDLLSFGAILSSVLVITSKNPVIAVIYLISLFINIAGYLILLGIGFVGISYIIIYIGAITVLFLFIIMMINIRLVDILELGNEYTKNLPLAILVGVLFIYELFSVLPFTINDINFFNIPLDILNYLNGLLFGLSSNNISSLSNIMDNTLNPTVVDTIINNWLQIEVLGFGLYTYGAAWLFICSIILLLAMLSAILLSVNSK